MLTKITHLTIYVHNQDDALAFYTKLGFVLHTDEDFGGMRWLTLCLPEQRDMEIALLLAQDDAEKALVGKQAAEKPFFNIESNDCYKDCEKLAAAGVKFAEKPAEKPWGISAAIEDLYGNVIYVCEPKVF